MPFTFSSLKNRKNKYLTRNLNNKTTTQKENTVNTTTAATTIRSFGFCNNVQADYLKAVVAEWEGAAAHLHSTITAISAKALAGAYRQMSDQMERYQQAPTESSCDQLMKKEQALQSQVDLATLALSHFIEKEGAFRPVSHLINTADAVHESCLGTETLESIAATKQRLTTLLQPSTLEEVADDIEAALLFRSTGNGLVCNTEERPAVQTIDTRHRLLRLQDYLHDSSPLSNSLSVADAWTYPSAYAVQYALPYLDREGSVSQAVYSLEETLIDATSGHISRNSACKKIQSLQKRLRAALIGGVKQRVTLDESLSDFGDFLQMANGSHRGESTIELGNRTYNNLAIPGYLAKAITHAAERIKESAELVHATTVRELNNSRTLLQLQGKNWCPAAHKVITKLERLENKRMEQLPKLAIRRSTPTDTRSSTRIKRRTSRRKQRTTRRRQAGA